MVKAAYELDPIDDSTVMKNMREQLAKTANMPEILAARSRVEEAPWALDGNAPRDDVPHAAKVQHEIRLEFPLQSLAGLHGAE